MDGSTTTIRDPSPRAQALSQSLEALIRERRGQDPGLGIPDTLVALELVKASLLDESGVTGVARRVFLVVAVALATVTAFVLFAMSR